MNLWTVPAADEASLLNIPQSLSNAIASPILARFGQSTPQFAWGARTGRNNTTNVMERMKPGDICLFYTISTNGPGSKYNLGMHFTPLATISCGFGIFQRPASYQILPPHWFENHSLLQKPIEKQAA